MQIRYCLLGATLIATPAYAGEMTVSIEIPQLRVAEYHRPYVAVWLQDAKGQRVADLAVWYDTKLKNQEGEKWLSDLRTWWRKSGRSLDLPVDGLSSPTRGPGKHVIRAREGSVTLPRLASGSYTLMVEAAREVGGREILSIPFSWPPKAPRTGTAGGTSELGAISLSIKP